MCGPDRPAGQLGACNAAGILVLDAWRTRSAANTRILGTKRGDR